MMIYHHKCQSLSMVAISLLAFNAGCNDSSRFNSHDAKKSESTTGQPDGSLDPASGSTPAGGSTGQNIDDSATAAGTPIINKFTYTKLKPEQPVDYLFIVDNSCSNEKLLQKSQEGLTAVISEAGVMPADARIAVMSTMVADEPDYSMPSAKYISKYNGIQWEPGFLDFISSAAVVNYKDKVPAHAGKWPLKGCDAAWFKPTDKDEKGNYCIKAAFQSTSSCVGAEAGITAFEQILRKNSGKPLFRNNALLNVVFVSDTHDPGSGNMPANTTKTDELIQLVQKDNAVMGVKFHALAPGGSSCANEKIYDESYYKLVIATGGAKENICSISSYADYMKAMVNESRKSVSPIYALEKKAEKIISVTIGDTAYSNYQYDAASGRIRLQDLVVEADEEIVITVTYLPKAD
jgi:hypothetical protein